MSSNVTIIILNFCPSMKFFFEKESSKRPPKYLKIQIFYFCPKVAYQERFKGVKIKNPGNKNSYTWAPLEGETMSSH